jgi:glucose-6-phosphate 1-dehydrogenase
MSKGDVQPPTLLVIFGITGDLSHRYLLPALAEIKKAGQLPADFKVVGISRRAVTAKDVLTEECRGLAPLLEVHTMDVNAPADYQNLKAELEKRGEHQIIFYFAVPPTAVVNIIKNLGEAGLNGPHTKLLLEKPFGVDYDSAKKLIEEIDAHYKEEQVFRIDHYLAKEMAQNITVFLGSNSIFQDLWNSQFIESIEITASEQIGIEGRVDFWEDTGTLRDFVQSHLLQLAALILMNPCSDIFDFDEIPRRRLAALRQLKPAQPEKAIRGQYKGYREEVKNSKSEVETFASLEVESEDPRWQGVPIYLTTGKRLAKRFTAIRVKFKSVDDAESNLLIFRVQPDEGIEIDLWIKQPGYQRELKKLKLDFMYEQGTRLPNAYEMIIVDAMRSNHSLFASSAEVLVSWQVIEPLLKAWGNGEGLVIYEPGSEVEKLIDTARSA